MIKSILRLIFCSLLLTGWGLAALSLHVVRTSDDIPITLVPKEKLGLTDTYVDTRKWTLDDVAAHPAVVEKLINSGKADVLRHVLTDQKSDVSAQLLEAVQRGPKKDSPNTTQPTTAEQTAQGLLGKIFQ